MLLNRTQPSWNFCPPAPSWRLIWHPFHRSFFIHHCCVHAAQHSLFFLIVSSVQTCCLYCRFDSFLVNCNVLQQLVNIAPTMCVQPSCQKKQTNGTKLPLYYAIRDHPDSIIRVLVECYPESLTIAVDPKGRLPLHLACIHGKSSILPLLLEQNPQAVGQCDNQNRLPIHYAASNIPKITTEAL